MLHLFPSSPLPDTQHEHHLSRYIQPKIREEYEILQKKLQTEKILYYKGLEVLRTSQRYLSCRKVCHGPQNDILKLVDHGI